MEAKNFSTGNLVWAKMKGYPPWPAKIIDAPSSKLKKNQHYVFFFGSENHAWIPDENIQHHSDEIAQAVSMKKKSSQFQNAIDCIVNMGKTESKKDKQPQLDKLEKENIALSPPKSASVGSIPKKKGAKSVPKHISPQHSTSKKRKPQRIFEEKQSNVESPSKRVKSHSLKTDDPYARIPLLVPRIKRLELEDLEPVDYSYLLASFSEHVQNGNRSSVRESAYVERPPTPELDLERVHDVLLSKKVVPTDKKIGFLGLGNMGRGIVMNLLKSGHRITVWNRSAKRCDPFVRAGAERGENPADVIKKCDIVFSCLSNPDAVKSTVFGKSGVIKGLDCSGPGKGYVEMTTIDPETASDVAEIVNLRGGKYLEAYINGTRPMGEEGTLLLLASGNHSLFDECRSCFQAMSKYSYFLDCEVGIASKMNLSLRMFESTVCGAIAEVMAILDRLSLSQDEYLEIVAFNSCCQTIMEKGRAVVERDFTTCTSLRHAQTALSLALQLAESCQLSTHMAAAANELYKKTIRMRYGDHDVSALYMALCKQR